MIGPQSILHAGLGPLRAPLGTPTGTPPLTTTGILNSAALGTTPVLVLDGACAGKINRVKIVLVTASRKLAYTTVAAGASAPTIAADGDGSADEGSLIIDAGTGGATEWITIPDNVDLYLVASAASTAYQITVASAP